MLYVLVTVCGHPNDVYVFVYKLSSDNKETASKI